MMTLHSNIIEWVFLSISLLLLACSGYSIREAIIDSAFLTANMVNGPRSLIADQNVREETIKLAIGCVMFFTSLVSLFLEPPPPPYTLVPQSVVSMVAWCLVASLMVASSWLAKSVRRRLLRYSPVEVSKVVETLPAVEGGRTNKEVADEASNARAEAHVRHGDQRQRTSDVKNRGTS